MQTHLALLRLGPWAALSRAQRGYVREHFVRPLLHRWYWSLLRFLLVLLGYSAGTFLVGYHPWWVHHWWCAVPLFVLAGYLPDLLDTVLVAYHREKIGHYIQEHEDEIKAAP